MSTEGSGASRAGGEDFHNEDAFLVEEGLGLYLVCDGDSRRPAGETAAAVAVEALEAFVAEAEAGDGPGLWHGVGSTAVVERGLRRALGAVLETAASRPDLEGMATTVTMLLARGSYGVIGHAGDSRAYLVRRGRGHRLTRDHELTRPLSNGGGDAAVDAFALPLQAGDRLILCTDGAEAVVEDPAIVRAAGELSPALLASRIVSAANRRDPSVDATAVVVRVRRDDERGWLELSSAPETAAFGHVLTRRS